MASSANAVLMKFFKLPPALRMMLALLGFGSLATLLFRFVPALRTPRGITIMLIIFGVGILIFGIVWLIRWMIGGKKSSSLDGALESQGPSRGDVAEQEQIYREKFRNKLAELKTNGLSVYRLPWFALIGEPGSGKTASLIHSGLDFPLGKDEVPGFGGTRNYNWWFTNEAVILDTAGRISFQEEGTTDKTEWEYFLKLLRNYRPRCPINGVIIALPADKLLRDNAEERQQKATVLRERLRQLQQQLGVRFPTFLLVTKMDLVGGFSEFFEEIRVDLQQRNQMFGWSRPGEFQDPFDPKDFEGAFNTVYGRLRDWSMRYLQRKATEDELGMIVTFPESFKQLRNPLDDYVSTIFQKSPLLEPPFFRGFYFTSAVQEGAPILDVFARTRATIAVPERATKAVDSKAFFIHDFYAKKVFPENGLVFRSAKHVSLNKRMRRITAYGSAAMIALMLTLFGIGIGGVRDLVNNPREDAATAAQTIESGASYSDLQGSIEIAQRLQKHYQAYNAGWAGLYARSLFIGANLSVPADAVRDIHSRFTLIAIAEPMLREVESNLSEYARAGVPGEDRERYLKALSVYTRWYGEVVGQDKLEALDNNEAINRRQQFETLIALLEMGEQDRKDAAEQFELALNALSDEPRSFAREVLSRTINFDDKSATDLIVANVAQIADHWKPLTQLSSDNSNHLVKYWAEFANHVGLLRDRYQEVLATTQQFNDADTFEDARDRFLRLTKGAEHLNDPELSAEPGTLHEAWANLRNFLATREAPANEQKQIIRLSRLLEVFAKQWDADFSRIRDALEYGAPQTDRAPQRAVYNALQKANSDLSQSFASSLAEIRARLGLPGDQDPLEYYVAQNLITITEANPPAPFTGTPELKLARAALGVNDRVITYLTELRGILGEGAQLDAQLNDLSEWPQLLAGAASAEPPGKTLSAWFSSVRADAGSANETEVAIQKSQLKDHTFWRPADLYDLARAVWTGQRATSVERMLGEMAARAQQTTNQDQHPGLARLMPGWDEPATTLPFVRHRFNARAAATPAPARPAPRSLDDEPAPRERDRDDDGGITRLRPRPRPQDRPETAVERVDSPSLLKDYHTRKLLTRTLRQYIQIDQQLEQRGDAPALRNALRAAAEAYITGYFTDWHAIYTDPTRLLPEDLLALLEQCGKGAVDWPAYVAAVTDRDQRFGTQLADRTEALIREVVLFDFELERNDVDNAVFHLIREQLALLRRANQSVPDMCRPMRDRRNQPGPSEGAPDVVFARQIVVGWNEYTRAVRDLGPLTGDAASDADPPSLRALQDGIVYKQATWPEFPLIAPLLDLAQHGQVLLVHDLSSKLDAMFADARNRYPVMPISDVRDESATYSRIANLKMLEPEEFLDLLRSVSAFSDRYGELFKDVRADEAGLRVLQNVDDWVRFLYGDERDALDRTAPRPAKVWLAAVRNTAANILNPAAIYTQLDLTLPVLNENGAPVGTRSLATQSGEGIQGTTVVDAIRAGDAPFRWDLFAATQNQFKPTEAKLYAKAPDADDDYPAEVVAWTLKGHPWALLMMLTARADNDLGDGYWKIPVVMDTPVETLGFWIAVRLGTEEQRFPGTIAPPPQPGAVPEMKAAENYLTASPR